MTALINPNFRRDAGGDKTLGSVVSAVSTSEGECPPGREAAGGSMSRPPLDSLPLKTAYVRCFFCQQTVSREQLDGHYCPGSPW